MPCKCLPQGDSYNMLAVVAVMHQKSECTRLPRRHLIIDDVLQAMFKAIYEIPEAKQV